MKKNLSLWMLGIAAMLASCSQSEELQQGADGQKSVTIAVNLEDAGSYAHSRALDPHTAEADAAVTRCYMEVIEGGVSTQLVSMSGDQTNGFTATLALNPANSYNFLFWADGGTGCYTITDEAGKRLQGIAVADGAAVSIAYQGAVTWDKESTVEATLTHAVAKVSVKTKTSLASGGTLTLTVPTYTGYNVGGSTDKLVGEETSQDYSITLTDPITADADAGALVCSCYVLYDGTDDLNLTYNDIPVVVYNVPLKPNQHTVLLGDVANLENLGMTLTTFTAKINSSWDDASSAYPLLIVDANSHTLYSGAPGLIAANSDKITEAMGTEGILKVVGPMKQADLNAIGAQSTTITTMLDLSEATGEIAIGTYSFRKWNTSSGSYITAPFQTLKLGSNVTSIANSAFSKATTLQEVDLSACSNLTSIGTSVFHLCTNITSLKLPENGKLETIGSLAFRNLAITSITFPETLKQVGSCVIEDSDIETLVFLSQEPPSVANDVHSQGVFTDFLYGFGEENTTKMSNMTIYLPNVQSEDAEANGWKAFFVDESKYKAVKYGESPATANP